MTEQVAAGNVYLAEIPKSAAEGTVVALYARFDTFSAPYRIELAAGDRLLDGRLEALPRPLELPVLGL